jgi:hypothetical protein
MAIDHEDEAAHHGLFGKVPITGQDAPHAFAILFVVSHELGQPLQFVYG